MNVINAIRWLLLLGVGTFLTYGGLTLPLRGDPDAPAAQHISPRYIERSLEETGTPNIVTAVLADYRSFDTLGETLVIFTAGMACFFVMRSRKREET